LPMALRLAREVVRGRSLGEWWRGGCRLVITQPMGSALPLTAMTAPLLGGAFLIGAVVGSFLNVVIYRVPRGRSIVWPGSHCPYCGLPIRPRDNVPILRFLWLRGRCRECHGPISFQYPLVEAGSGVLFALCLQRFGPTPFLLVAWAFAAALLAVSVIDARLRIIPDVVTLPGTMLAFVLPGVANLLGRGDLWPVSMTDVLFGYFVGAGSLLAVAVGYLLLTGREGMGLGDVKLMGLCGALLGWKGVLLAILLGSVIGTLVAVPLVLLRGGGRRTELPFGPYLAAGSLVVLLYGNRMIEWYMQAAGWR